LRENKQPEILEIRNKSDIRNPTSPIPFWLHRSSQRSVCPSFRRKQHGRSTGGKFCEVAGALFDIRQKGETIGVEGPDTTAPLMEAVYEELLRAGAFPVIRMSPVGLTEIFMKNGRDLHFDQLPKFELAYAKAVDGTVRIMGSNNTRALSSTDPTRMARFAKTRKPVRKILLAKKWSLTLFPTQAYAQDAEMSLREFEDFVYRANLLHLDDPVAAWRPRKASSKEADQQTKKRGPGPHRRAPAPTSRCP
jgi:hypothetical protein